MFNAVVGFNGVVSAVTGVRFNGVVRLRGVVSVVFNGVVSAVFSGTFNGVLSVVLSGVVSGKVIGRLTGSPKASASAIRSAVAVVSCVLVAPPLTVVVGEVVFVGLVVVVGLFSGLKVGEVSLVTSGEVVFPGEVTLVVVGLTVGLVTLMGLVVLVGLFVGLFTLVLVVLGKLVFTLVWPTGPNGPSCKVELDESLSLSLLVELIAVGTALLDSLGDAVADAPVPQSVNAAWAEGTKNTMVVSNSEVASQTLMNLGISAMRPVIWFSP